MQKMLFQQDDEEFFIPVPFDLSFVEAIDYVSQKVKRKRDFLLKKARETKGSMSVVPYLYYAGNRGLGRIYKIRWEPPAKNSLECTEEYFANSEEQALLA